MSGARINWRAIVGTLTDEWSPVAHDVPVGSADYVRKRYGIDLRLEGIDDVRHVAATAYARRRPRGVDARERYARGEGNTIIDHQQGRFARFLGARAVSVALSALHSGDVDANRFRWNSINDDETR